MKQTETVMDSVATLDHPRIERRGPLLIAGIPGTFTPSSGPLAAPWERFTPQLRSIPGRVGQCTYGVCIGCGGADTFQYLCGVEVAHASVVPQDWSRLSLPAQTYAVFAHDGHVTRIRETIRVIFEEWLPQSGLELAPTAAEVPDLFERYGPAFDARTGSGDIEVWIPVKPSANEPALRRAGMMVGENPEK